MKASMNGMMYGAVVEHEVMVYWRFIDVMPSYSVMPSCFAILFIFS